MPNRQADHPIYAALCAYERARDMGAAGPRAFLVAPPWGLGEKYLGLKRARAIPGLQGKHLFALWRTRARGALRLPSCAAGFQLKEDMTRIRAFYPERGVCVKIVDAAIPQTRARIMAEIGNRRRVEALGTITLPRILSVTERGEYIGIEEEMLCGRRFSLKRDAALFTGQGLRELTATYRAAGIRREPLADYYSAHLAQGLRHGHGKDQRAAAMAEVLERAFAAGALADISLCHNDLVPSNLCVAGGRLYFLDWDMSREGPVVADTLRLALRYPRKAGKLARAARAALGGILPPDSDLRPAFTAAIAQTLLAAPRKSADLLTLWQTEAPHWRGSS